MIYTPATTDTEPNPSDLALPHRPSKRRQSGSLQTGTARQRRSIEQMHRLTSSYLLKVFPRSKRLSTDIIRNGFSQKIRFLGGAQTGVGLNHIDLVVCNIAMRFWDQSTRR